MNRNQVSRNGFAGQQNNPLFFKDSKRCLGCPDMCTFLDEWLCGTKLHVSRANPLYATTGQREQAHTELSAAVDLYQAMKMTFWLPETEAALVQR
jgi:hypothetical protein